MADPPFGFGLPGQGRGSGGSGGSGSSGGPPAEGGPFGPLGDPQQFAEALRQFADLMSWQGGPVNWELAKNVARHALAAEGDPSVLDTDRNRITEAVRLQFKPWSRLIWLDKWTEKLLSVRSEKRQPDSTPG